MPSIRIRHVRRTLAVLVLAAASSILTPAGLHAGPRDRQAATERRVLRDSHPIWRFLLSLWEENGLRIDDNG